MAVKIPTYNGHLTKNFGYQEMIKSSTADRLGISNDASREHVINLVNLCNFILQPIRDEFGVIRINSGYRSPALNKAVGGSKTSQHCNGQAADFESTRISNPDLAKWIEKNLVFGLRHNSSSFLLQVPTTSDAINTLNFFLIALSP